jgi:Coenzyme PQQ synthesis protein D (PqqD)
MTFPQRLSAECIVQRDAQVIAAEVDQDLVMVSITNGFYYGVTNVGREIWEAIEHPRKVSGIIDELSATYEVDRSSCEEQTLCFLEDLLKENLIQVRNELAK